ncbi:M23 family metallopeptidase [Sorangium sp. So ce1389]|uniref:M23 family metallopeptidase n=1 Tax=Sorangium sp. So ce1389 TaxID=3133336 RepID=UPI003F5E83AE
MARQRFEFMVLAISATSLAPLAGCAPVDEVDETGAPAVLDDVGASTALDDEELVSEAAQPITVSGMGHYCSMTWPGGGWGFQWNLNDPCSDLSGQLGSGGTIRRAGVFSISGVNSVVARCNGGTSIWAGVGDDPLQWAYDASLADSGCVITVAPKVMRIFDRPFSSTVSVTAGTGFDFAQSLYPDLDVSQFGQSGSATANVVDWKGRDKSTSGFIDDHNGYDWNMAEGTVIRAVADGVVRKSRWLTTTCTGSNSPTQGEIYIDHTVTRSPTTYNELFTSGYFHLKELWVADGSPVTKGQEIGKIGWVGCSSQSHLHFAVIRMSNTATDRFETLTIDSNGNDGWRNVIDPYGFDPPTGFDPWGWRAYSSGAGALSITLWNSGQAPPTGSW